MAAFENIMYKGVEIVWRLQANQAWTYFAA